MKSIRLSKNLPFVITWIFSLRCMPPTLFRYQVEEEKEEDIWRLDFVIETETEPKYFG